MRGELPVGNIPEKIILEDDSTISVPDLPIIPCIEGDGIGPDTWKATRLVLDAAVEKAFQLCTRRTAKRKDCWMQ